MDTSARSPISIGCEAGGPEAAFVCRFKVPLYRALAKHVTSTHCVGVDEYAVVFRVDGSFAAYGNEGLANIRYAQKRRYITVDAQIPSKVWQAMDTSRIREYLASQLRLAIASCVARLREEKHTVNEEALNLQLYAAIAEYLATST